MPRERPPLVETSPSIDAAARAPAREGASLLGDADAQRALTAQMSTAPLVRMTFVGQTSLVFRVVLEDGLEVAWKPIAVSNRPGFRAELAAYRLAVLLGLDTVPPVVARGFTMDEVLGALDRDDAYRVPRLRRELVTDASGRIEGAAILWIAGMREAGLESPEAMRTWTPWLRQHGEVPSESSALARDLSDMAVFDHLIGNWDRYSGSNMKQSADGTRLYIRDHNIAFQPSVEGARRERHARRLLATERFSRQTILALRAIGERDVGALGEPTLGVSETPPLSAEQIRDVLVRRDEILAHVDALVTRYGADAVLAFP